MMITKAVIVQITMVSMKGSNKATKPFTGRIFGALQSGQWKQNQHQPHLEKKAALLNPTKQHPITPPTPIAFFFFLKAFNN